MGLIFIILTIKSIIFNKLNKLDYKNKPEGLLSGVYLSWK